MNWFAMFLLVFFLVNVVRVGMAYFGKKLSAVPESSAETDVVGKVSRGQIGAAVMEVVEKKIFPGVANLYDGIRTREQLEELVDKIGAALDGSGEALGEADEAVTEEAAIDEIMEAEKKKDM